MPCDLPVSSRNISAQVRQVGSDPVVFTKVAMNVISCPFFGSGGSSLMLFTYTPGGMDVTGGAGVGTGVGTIVGGGLDVAVEGMVG